MIARLYPLKANPQGVAFSASNKRWNIAVAGRRSGKTERAKRRLLGKAIIGSDFITPRFGAFAPTSGQAKKIFWEDLKEMTKPLWEKKPNETELAIRLVNGSEIIVAGLDEPARIEGFPWDYFLIDESDDIKNGFWGEHLRPCLSDRLGCADFIGVPNGLGFLYDLREKALLKPQDYGFFAWHSSDVLPAAEIEDARQDLDERTFRQEYEASFENAAGRVYYAFSRLQNAVEPPTDLAATAILSVGMDFNVNPMSAVICFESNGNTYAIDFISIQTSNTEEMIKEIKHRYGDRVKNAYPDPTGRKGGTNAPVGQSDHSILKDAGFSVFCRGVSNVREGINAVNSRFRSAAGQCRLFLSPTRCQPLISALERHCYKDGTSQPNKNDEWNHGTDALKYYVEYLHPVKQRQQWQQ